MLRVVLADSDLLSGGILRLVQTLVASRPTRLRLLLLGVVDSFLGLCLSLPNGATRLGVAIGLRFVSRRDAIFNARSGTNRIFFFHNPRLGFLSRNFKKTRDLGFPVAGVAKSEIFAALQFEENQSIAIFKLQTYKINKSLVRSPALLDITAPISTLKLDSIGPAQ